MKVLEVGALDINGSVRAAIERLRPLSYTGVDIQKGPGVDLVCKAESLIELFGSEQFDLLISTEVLEHIRDWRKAISNFKKILKPGGVVIMTTRSEGFGYHGYPSDFWRYETADMQYIFSDFRIEALESDPIEPGIFMKARRPEELEIHDCGNYAVYSIMRKKRIKDIGNFHILFFKLRYPVRSLLSKYLPLRVKDIMRNYFQIR